MQNFIKIFGVIAILAIITVVATVEGFCQVQFTDIAIPAGVNDAGSGQGVVSFDFDNDGLLDIYLVNNGQTNRLYKNLDGEIFSDVGATCGVNYTGNGRGCAAGDYNNDGFTDLVIGNWTQMLILYRNDSASFTNASVEAGMNLLTWGGSINWFDWDNDGKLDCYVGNDGIPLHNNYFFHNEDLTSFSEIAANVGLIDDRSTLAVASADYDNDGDIDFFIGNQTGSPTGVLYRNDGTTFTDVSIISGLATYSYTWGADWGDYDNDGDLDLYLCNSNGNNQCFKNNGDGSFTEVAASLGIDDPSQSFSCGWADYDNDSDLDLYVSNGQSGVDKLYRNDGIMFSDVTSASGIVGNQHTGSFTWGDLNNDGFLDLYLSNNGTANNLYMSNAGNWNNWIVLKLEGVNSNRSAIGARVKIIAGGQSQIREVQGGSGHNGQHSLPVEFGIGQAVIVDSIVINWPSGIEQIITEVLPNQILDVTELQTEIDQYTYVITATGLQQNYPNPFNPSTTISFYLTTEYAENTEIIIYNIKGQKVKMLIDEKLEAGCHQVIWDGKDENSKSVSSGIYFYKMETGKYVSTKKMILMK